MKNHNGFFLLIVTAAAIPILTAANTKIAPRGGGEDSVGSPARGSGGRSAISTRPRSTGRSARSGATRAPSPPVVIKMQRRTVPKPQVIRNSRNIVRDRTTVLVPDRYENGKIIQKRATIIAPQEHRFIVNNTTIIKDIHRHRRVEVVPSRYYWHTVDKVRYCHYYHHGIHWYGFYHGPTFYWTRYYNNYWWWFDVRFNRWVYWWNGYWWWPGPGAVVYVYMDNNYYPYVDGHVTVVKPEVQPPPDESPAVGEGNTWMSPDQKRMVQVVGKKSEAFLYDNSSGNPAFIKYLGQGVEQVRYSGGDNGIPLQILLDYEDNSFALFNSEGDPQDTASTLTVSPPIANPPPEVQPLENPASPPPAPPEE